MFRGLPRLRVLKPVVVKGIVGFGLLTLLCEQSPVFKIEQVTKTKIPESVTVKQGDGLHEFSKLLGYGVRTVTLFGIAVYAVSIHLKETKTKQLSRWNQEYTPEKLIKGQADHKWFVEDLSQSEAVIRIEPVRNTDGPHLRNGFVRLLTSRLQKEQQNLTSDETNAFLKAVEQFRSLFAAGTIKKGQVVLLAKLQNNLSVYLDDKLLGSVQSELLSKWLLEGYIMGGESNAPSPTLLQSVASNLK